MRKILHLLLALAIPFLLASGGRGPGGGVGGAASGGGTPVTITARSNYNYSTGGAGTVAYTADNLSGSLLVCYVITLELVPGTPSDSQGNVWQDSGAGAIHVHGQSYYISVSYAENSKAGANTVSCTNAYAMHIIEFTGPLTSNSNDGYNSSTSTAAQGTNNIDAGAVVASQAGELYVVGTAVQNGPLSVGTDVAWAAPIGDHAGMLEYYVKPESGSKNGVATTGYAGTDDYGAIVVAFKAQMQ
jgi:hypothetical protein